MKAGPIDSLVALFDSPMSSSAVAAAAQPVKTTRQLTRDINTQVKRNMTTRLTELNKIMDVAFRTKKQKITVNGTTYALRQIIAMLKKEYMKTTKYLELKPNKPKAGDAPAMAKPALQNWLRSKLSRLHTIEPQLGAVLQNATTGITTKKIVSRLISIGIDKGFIPATTSTADAKPFSPTVNSVRSIPSIHVIVDDSIRNLDSQLAASAVESATGGHPTVLLIQLLSAIGRHYTVIEDPSDEERRQTKADMDFLEQLKKRPKDGEDPERVAIDNVKRKFMEANIRMIQAPGQNPTLTRIYREQLIEYLSTEDGATTLRNWETKLSKLKPSKSVPIEKIDKLRQYVDFASNLMSEADSLRRSKAKATSTGAARSSSVASPTRARTPTMRPTTSSSVSAPVAPPAPAPAPIMQDPQPTSAATSARRTTAARSAAKK